MSRRQRVLLVVGGLGILVLFVALWVANAPAWSAPAAMEVQGDPRNRQYLVAFVGLVTLGVLALGMDFRDWL